jgi:Gpi18-like mannosyltransferase
LGITIISGLIRLAGFQFVPDDYKAWIFPWIEHLSLNGHFFGIATIKSDYLPFYHYLLSIVSFLPKDLWLPSVKIISCLFDFLLAFTIGKIVLHIYNSKLCALTAYALILMCPTVFLNSGIWAQCESIYAAFVFLSLLYFLKKKTALALFVYGIAISIKLQAVFILPFIIFLYFERSFPFNKLVYLFAGFISTIAIGLPFGAHIQALKAYFRQLTGYSDGLTHNAPSVFALFNANNDEILLGRIGIIFVMTIMFGMLLLIIYNVHSKMDENNFEQTGITYITLFFFCALTVPFFLPRMHERYFYLAETASILYAVIIPRRWYITLLVILPSCVTYFNFLFGNGANLFSLGLILMSAVILVNVWTVKSVLNYEKNIN